MIIYNITTKVHPAIEAAWLQWQREEHIPEVIHTGLFTGYKLFRLLEQDDSEGSTYVIQYTASDMEQYQQYNNQFASLHRKKTVTRWGDQFIAFRSIMEVVN